MADFKSILIIEDNDKVRRYYAEHLISPHHVIFEAATGQAGLDLYRSQPIDCVVLDLSLPDMSGFELLPKLVPVAAQPPVPVVILTSLESGALLEVAKLNGAFAGLQKDTTSGDDLAHVVVRAMSAIPVEKKASVAFPQQSLSA